MAKSVTNSSVEDDCKKFCSLGQVFLDGDCVLLKSLRHMHRGILIENKRLPTCNAQSQKVVKDRHQKTMANVIQLLQFYSINITNLHCLFQDIYHQRKHCSPKLYAKAREIRHRLHLHADLVLQAVEAIIKCQLKYMSKMYTKPSPVLEKDEVFKVIKVFNIVLENIRQVFVIVESEDDDENPSIKLSGAGSHLAMLSIPGPSAQKQIDSGSTVPPVEKFKTVIVPETLESSSSCIKKFTASKILHILGSVRARQITEYIAETLLSRIDVPSEDGEPPKLHYPWKPVTFGIGSSTQPHVDIFEEALAREEDENQLNQRKLDMALRQEFGDDFPGTDYLPAECSVALRPLHSSRMDTLITTNSVFLELLFKKFLNTNGVIVPSLIRSGQYGELRLSKVGRARLEGYYVDQVWGVGAQLVDELLLWTPLLFTRDAADQTDGIASAPGVAGAASLHSIETTTPSSVCSTASSDATVIIVAQQRKGSDALTTGPKTLSKVPRFSVLPQGGLAQGSFCCNNFLAPIALSVPFLLYFHEAFCKYIRRGVLPGWCSDSCEAVGSECSHLATQSSLDRHLVIGLSAYSRRSPQPVRLPDGNYSTNGGNGFSAAMELLVWLVNQIEKTEPEKEEKDWPIADLVEHLAVFGSLCSSALCWLQLRSECLLHTWTTAPYYLLTQADLPLILTQLYKLKIEEREYLAKTDDLQRAVLVPYREKLVARAHALVRAATKQESVAVEALSSVCRTVALAYLQNSMPSPHVWRGLGRMTNRPHPYVAEYVGTVLKPVLDAVSQLGDALQRRAGSAVLKVVCYAWLEHIRRQKLKFSLWGAQQLLRDFGALSDWVRNYPGFSPGAREQVLGVDVLRECEGVARLLMRQPPLVDGLYSANQVAPLPNKPGVGHVQSISLSGKPDDIPAEMYVPNQAVWLSRRARPASSVCVKASICCTWPC